MVQAANTVDRLLTTLVVLVCILPAAAYAQADSTQINFSISPNELPSVQVNQAEDGIEIRSVRVEGLEYLDESTVITGLTIKAGDILVGNVTAKLNAASEALYNTGWYQEKPLLALDSQGEGAVLKVTVHENPIYQGTTITGNTLFSTGRILQEVEGGPDGGNGQMKPGDVINVRSLQRAIDGISRLYADAGYIAAGVNNFSFSYAGADEGMVTLDISEGFVEDIIIAGLEGTREDVVRSQITHLHAGSVLTQDDIYRDINQIYNTGLFETVEPDIEQSLKPGYVQVILNVTEAATGQVGFGLGYSTINGLQGSVNYNEKNLFGSGKVLGATVVFSRNKPGLQLTYSDPYYKDDSFYSVSLYSLHERQQAAPGSAYESELAVDTQGVSLGYGQHLNEYDSWQSTFTIADYDYEVRKGDPFRGTDPRTRARLSAKGQTRKVGLSYTHDTRDNIFSTHQGIYVKPTWEIAGLGGDFSFQKQSLEAREFFKFGSGTLGFRERVGMGSGDIPIYEQWRLGGVQSVRGIPEDMLQGTHHLLLNGEYRVPFNDTVGGVAFMDAGWAGNGFDEMDNAVSAGLGARIKLSFLGVNAVRLDYAWQIAGDKEDHGGSRFHFFLGEMF
ncbi:MAG: BamA/TamA family outer membrane protein [Planctomycetales bacterium]|nr:BamA/TamA family outer membrane protein [bacterium]UNM07034.1 MAG: BamA/TamA family outer membrane protein [Planctomycetales bacterium]